MIDERNAYQGAPSQPRPSLLMSEPDPMPRPSGGRLGAGALALVAILAAFILGVVLYGLNNSG